jgi:cytochrome c553
MNCTNLGPSSVSASASPNWVSFQALERLFLVVVAGVTPTASGLVFGGDLAGNLLAFDSGTGKLLLQKSLGGPLAGGLITYAVGGHQYLAVTAGNVSRSVFGTGGSPRVVILTLGVASNQKVRKLAVVVPAHRGTVSGRDIFGSMCSSCHGDHGEGGPGAPAIRDVGSRMDFNAVVQRILDPRAPMPKLFPDPLDEHEVRSVAAYVLALSKSKDPSH